jgi:hypothetical protein
MPACTWTREPIEAVPIIFFFAVISLVSLYQASRRHLAHRRSSACRSSRLLDLASDPLDIFTQLSEAFLVESRPFSCCAGHGPPKDKHLTGNQTPKL